MDSVLHFVRIGCALLLACCVLYKTARATAAAVVRRRRRRLAEKQDPRLEQISLSLSLSLSLLNDECVKSQQKGEHKRDDDAPLKRGVEDFCVPTTNKREIKKTTDDQKTTTPTTTPATHHVS